MLLLTFGHGTAPREQIVELLRAAGVRALVDIRTAPGSRRHPHVARAELARWLPDNGIAYRWERRLGGFRKPAPDSPDVVWHNPSFRGYAGYTRTPNFLAAVDDLIDQIAQVDHNGPTNPDTSGDADAPERTAPPHERGHVVTMCSEAVWWRCHRRILADYVLLSRRLEVRHLMHDGRLMPHPPTSGVRLRADGLLCYDAGQEKLPL